MPWFTFRPIELKDSTKCIGCPYFDEFPMGDKMVDTAQQCKAAPRHENKIYYVGLDQETWETYVIGEKFKRPTWCPLISFDGTAIHPHA